MFSFILTRQICTVKCTAIPTLTTNRTAGTALNFMSQRPIIPRSCRTTAAREEPTNKAAQKFSNNIPTTTTLAVKAANSAMPKQFLKSMYCSQKRNGIPEGKFGRPRSSNFLHNFLTLLINSVISCVSVSLCR